MTLWLVGMMGSGKSSAGRLAASRLNVPFTDTDEMVEAAARATVSAIWETRGEGAFRQMEADAVARASRKRGIVATGGGVVLSAINRRRLVGGTAVVWLEAPLPVLAERLASESDRPGLTAAGEDAVSFLGELLAQREHLYEQVSTYRITTEHLEPNEVATRIVDIWNG